MPEQTDRQDRLFGVAVALATALAAAFVLWHLGRAPLDRDEVASVTDAHRSLGGTLDVLWAREGNMWPYYLFLNLWTHLGGTGEAWVRLPAALCAIASVPVTMFLARRLFGVPAAVLTGLTLACTPMLLETAQFARAYGVILLLMVISASLLVAGVQRPRRATWIAWGVVSGFAAHFHMLSALVVCAQAASLLLLPRAAVPWRDVRAGAIAFGVVIAPMVVYALLGDSGQTSWIGPITAQVLAGFGKTVTGSRPLEVLVALLYACALVTFVAQLRRDGRSEETWRQGLVLGWIVLPPVALAILSVAKPLFTPNYLVGVLPAGFDFTDPFLNEAAIPHPEFELLRRTAPIHWVEQAAGCFDGMSEESGSGYWAVTRHADRDELTAWVGAMQNKPKRTFLVHGETENSFPLADHLRQQFGMTVDVPEWKQSVEV